MRHDAADEQLHTDGVQGDNDVWIVEDPVATFRHGLAGVRVEAASWFP